jgi:hypothetical protein
MSYDKLPSDCVTRYETFLTKFFGNKTEEFKKLLKECNAFTAGGSVLSAILNENSYNGDIDVYVNISKAGPLRDFLGTFKEGIVPTNRSGDNKYSKNFLDINQIKKIVKFHTEKGDNGKTIDLVYISNSRSVESVVTNFDFTCCQSWYDTESIYTTHLDSIISRKVSITKTFSKFFITPDKYSIKRLEKYTNKGFDIILPEQKAEDDSIPEKINEFQVIYDCLYGWTFNYNSKVNGLNTHFFTRYKFNKKMDICTDHKKANTVIDKFQNKYKYIFSGDTYDPDEFRTYESYQKAGLEDTVNINIKYAYQYACKEIRTGSVKSYRYKVWKSIHNLLSSTFPEIIENVEINLDQNKNFDKFKEIATFDSEKLKELNKYPEISKVCYAVNYEKEINIGEFLSIDDNIIIIFEGKYKGYSRTEIIKFLQKNKDLSVTLLPDNLNIFNVDILRFETKYFKVYKIKSTGLKNVKDLAPIYNVIPYGVTYLKGK